MGSEGGCYPQLLSISICVKGTDEGVRKGCTDEGGRKGVTDEGGRKAGLMREVERRTDEGRRKGVLMRETGRGY